MPAQKLPWRTVITSSEDQVGRLNRAELRKALQEAKELREARTARTGRRERKAGTTRDR